MEGVYMKKIMLLLVLSTVVFTSCPIYAGRPFSTEDAGVAGNGTLQLELSFDYAKTGSDKSYSFLTVPIYGVSERLEVSLEFPYTWILPEEEKNVDGLEDISFIVKGLLIEESQDVPA